MATSNTSVCAHSTGKRVRKRSFKSKLALLIITLNDSQGYNCDRTDIFFCDFCELLINDA